MLSIRSWPPCLPEGFTAFQSHDMSSPVSQPLMAGQATIRIAAQHPVGIQNSIEGSMQGAPTPTPPLDGAHTRFLHHQQSGRCRDMESDTTLASTAQICFRQCLGSARGQSTQTRNQFQPGLGECSAHRRKGPVQAEPQHSPRNTLHTCTHTCIH